MEDALTEKKPEPFSNPVELLFTLKAGEDLTPEQLEPILAYLQPLLPPPEVWEQWKLSIGRAAEAAAQSIAQSLAAMNHKIEQDAAIRLSVEQQMNVMDLEKLYGEPEGPSEGE
jgi:hypothetical protein